MTSTSTVRTVTPFIVSVYATLTGHTDDRAATRTFRHLAAICTVLAAVALTPTTPTRLAAVLAIGAASPLVTAALAYLRWSPRS